MKLETVRKEEVRPKATRPRDQELDQLVDYLSTLEEGEAGRVILEPEDKILTAKRRLRDAAKKMGKDVNFLLGVDGLYVEVINLPTEG